MEYLSGSGGANSDHGHPRRPPWARGGLFLVSESDSAAVSDTGATAGLARFRWLEHYSLILQRGGNRQVTTYPASARFRFGDGHLGEVCRAADIPVGFAGGKGKFATFALDADIPELLRKGALEAARGQLDCSRGISTLRKQGANIPLRLTRMGQYIPSAADFGEGPSRRPGGAMV